MGHAFAFLNDHQQIKNCSWTHNDETKQGMIVPWIFNDKGYYFPKLSCIENGQQIENIFRINVELNKPDAKITGLESKKVLANQEVTLSAAKSTSDNGEIKRYDWHFCNGDEFLKYEKEIKITFSRF